MGIPDNSMFELYTSCSEPNLPDWKKYLVKLKVYLEDKPGMLARVASIIGDHQGNIVVFDYNRSEDANMVLMEVCFEQTEQIEQLIRDLAAGGLLAPSQASGDDVQVIDTDSILEIVVRLQHRPGELGRFAEVLREEDANVIYFRYNESRNPESADIALSLSNSGLVDRLLHDLNEHNYHYRVLFRGIDEQAVQQKIGLKLTERFFLRLKKLMPDSDVEQLKELVRSSREISDYLVQFAHESSKDLEAGEIYTRILMLASRSLSRTGSNFVCREQAPIELTENVTLRNFILPTGGVVYLLQGRKDSVLLDTGYGLYYEDLCKYWKQRDIDPARIRAIYVSHPDADHAGMTGYFQRDYGMPVFMHPKSEKAIGEVNRAWGSDSTLLKLNELFTRLVNAFTKFEAPEEIIYYKKESGEKRAGLPVMQTIKFEDVSLEILESFGGHVPSQVYFYCAEHGLLFSSDCLLNLDSLSPEDRELLTIPRFLMTSTNADSRTFKKEMKALERLILGTDEQLKSSGRYARVFPGHGDYYRAYLLSR